MTARKAESGRLPLSLLVTTYNRPNALALVLASVARQTVRPFEVVVADDGSGPETRVMVDEHRSRLGALGIGVTHAWHPDEGFRAAAIRNCAIRQARGEYLVFLDGDCVLHPEFTAHHQRFARAGTFVQGGRVLLGGARTREALAAGSVPANVMRRGIGNRLSGLSIPWLSSFVSSPRDPLRGVRSCNLAVWRSDVLAVNGFDERYVGWGREDSDFVARLGMAGVERRKLKFGGIVYHLWHPERARASLDANHIVYEEALARGEPRAVRGVAEHTCSVSAR